MAVSPGCSIALCHSFSFWVGSPKNLEVKNTAKNKVVKQAIELLEKNQETINKIEPGPEQQAITEINSVLLKLLKEG